MILQEIHVDILALLLFNYKQLIYFCCWLIFRRKAVTTAALEQWPGNDLPVFKNDKAATEELETLVSTLEETCSFEPAGFNKEGIKQHVLDVLNERRRRIRKGHDYTQVSSFIFTNSVIKTHTQGIYIKY